MISFIILSTVSSCLGFLDTILVFLRCKDGFTYLRLMKVCLSLGEDLQTFFRARYHILPGVTKYFSSYFSIFLVEFNTIFKVLPLLAAFKVCFCILTIYFQSNKYMFVLF